MACAKQNKILVDLMITAMAMVNALCSRKFQMHTNFEDLEQQHKIGGIFVDFTAKKALKAAALSALRSFLQNDEGSGKILREKSYEGFSFVEAAYIVFRCSKIERQLVKMDILSSFSSMLIRYAKETLKYLQESVQNADTREIAQNNLRLCIFFLGHILCIVEDPQVKLPPQKEHQDKLSRSENTMNDSRHLELKASSITLLWNILQIQEQAFASIRDIKAAGEIIRAAAVSCLIHQRWGDRGMQARASLEILRKAILGILSDPFIRALSFQSEVPWQTFTSLLSLCVKHKHLIAFMADFMAHLMVRDGLAGISFMSQVVKRVAEKCTVAVDGEKTACLQDEIGLESRVHCPWKNACNGSAALEALLIFCQLLIFIAESAMTLLADFATRHDAIVITSLHLGSLFQTLRNERSTIRKCFSVIAGCCLKRFEALSPVDQHILAQLHDVLSRDRDATSRLRALTNIASDLKWIHCSHEDSLSLFICTISQRVLDKSKIVRLKAIQILEAIFLDTVTSSSSQRDSPLHSVISRVPYLFSNISKLLAISPESGYFCTDTLQAAGRLLCSPCLKGSAMFEMLDSILYFSFNSSNLTVISHIFHFHLDGYETWVRFLATRNESSIAKLQNLLMMTAGNEKSDVKKYQKLVEQAFVALEHHYTSEMRNESLIGSCTLIAILAPFNPFTVPDAGKIGQCFLHILASCMKPISNLQATEDQTTNKQIVMWAFKALAVLLKEKNKILEKEVKTFIKNHFLYLQENKVTGYLDCLYSLSNPLGMVRNILQLYEEQCQVLETLQPLKTLHMYISFLGDISRNYEMACNSFIKCLRNVEMDLCKPINFGNTTSQFDYLQQEELKAMEEDAVARFTQMLLDGDSVPGCYVPFLRELVLAESLPTILRVAATESLGQYMLASSHLAKDNGDILDLLFQTEIPHLKMAALSLAEKLIVSFPNEFLYAITLIETCLKDDTIKERAYCAYVRLLLEDKLKLEMLLAPICDGLCEGNEKVRNVVIFLLKKLLKDSGRSKIKYVLHLYNHTANAESRHRLVEVLVEDVLDNEDLQSDELASSILQLVIRGKNEAAFFASFLNPSSKVLNTMLSYLNANPPKICMQGDSEAEKNLIQFVMNHKRQGPSAADKDLVAKLLDILGSKRRRKRKGVVRTEAASFQSVEEYEAAIESFKSCKITNSLWDILRMDI